ncbi:phage portal protein [Streptomyces sp. NPDC051452]|uniref:phage portal protein n=1 Tax=Streptomyces sp. NPDC051452 TaxID=3365654 RepID=UPI003793B608
MPLPAGGAMAWPPPELAPVAKKLTEWSAWYAGDGDALVSVYSLAGSATTPLSQTFFQSDKPYGASGPATAARTFWGQPLTPGTVRTKLHVPVASDIAELSANLLFGEMPTFTATDKATQKELDAFQTDGMHSSLREAAELTAALGGVYLKVVWDETLSDRPWLVPMTPEQAVPTWAWDRLRDVTFWTCLHQDDDSTIRLLECHEVGAISYGLYEGTPTELGERIPLSSFEGTQHLAELYGESGVMFTGLPWLTAAYVPNVKPNRIWQGIRCAVNFGRSDFSGVELLMDALDETYTSWMRDLRLGKSRIIVPSSMLESEGPGKGGRLDLEREAFVGMEGMLTDPNSSGITLNQFNIRVAEHQVTAETLFEQIVSSAGYSVQSFGGKGDVAAVTATEIQARKEQSLNTRDQKILYWRPALQHLFQALLGIDRLVFGAQVKPEAGIDVAFPDAVQPSLRDMAETLGLLLTAQSMSTKLRVQTLHPTWTETQVAQEVAAILADEQASTPAARAAPVVAPALPQ